MDESKLAAGSMPVFIIAVALAARWWPSARTRPRSPVRTRPVALALIIFLLVWPLQKRTRLVVYAPAGQVEAGSGSLATLGLSGTSSPQATLAELDQLITTVQSLTSPSDRIFVAPTSPLIYYLSDRVNAARYDYLDPVDVSPNVDAEIERSLRSRPPAVVVLSGEQNHAWRQSTDEIAPLTMDLVHRSYRVRTTIGPWRVLVRQKH